MSIFLSVDVVNEWCDKSPYTGNFDRKWFIDLGLTVNQMCHAYALVCALHKKRKKSGLYRDYLSVMGNNAKKSDFKQILKILIDKGIVDYDGISLRYLMTIDSERIYEHLQYAIPLYCYHADESQDLLMHLMHFAYGTGKQYYLSEYTTNRSGSLCTLTHADIVVRYRHISFAQYRAMAAFKFAKLQRERGHLKQKYVYCDGFLSKTSETYEATRRLNVGLHDLHQVDGFYHIDPVYHSTPSTMLVGAIHHHGDSVMYPVVMYVAKTKTVEKPAPLNAL